MGKSIVEIVVDALLAIGIRAQRAFPAQMMPAVDSLFAAVGMKELDQAAGTATVEVSVLAPAAMGAAKCEDQAVWICHCLKSIGGSYKQEKAVYDPDTELFCVRVAAVFAGQETISGWKEPMPAPSFSVKLGTVILNNVVSFDAVQAISEEVPTLNRAYWNFRLEEKFPLDSRENETPGEPFAITVTRESGEDVYSECTVTSRKRIFCEDGLYQIREGTAAKMTTSI